MFLRDLCSILQLQIFTAFPYFSQDNTPKKYKYIEIFKSKLLVCLTFVTHSIIKNPPIFPLRQPTSLRLRRTRDMGVVPGPPEANVAKQSAAVRVPTRP